MEYEQELSAQRAPYQQWLTAQERELALRYGGKAGDCGKRLCRFSFSSCMDSVQDIISTAVPPEDKTVVCLFVRQAGELSPYAEAVFPECFCARQEIVFAYADEDYLEGGVRCRPWFKPDFSPDTLGSFFYIGSVFAVRGDVLCSAVRRCGGRGSLYQLVYDLLMEEGLCGGRRRPEAGIIHIPNALYTNAGTDRESCLEGKNCVRETDTGAAEPCAGLVSIVIPSKDNADVLRRCLMTLVRGTQYKDYELLIVDNGSNDDQRAHVEELLDELRAEYSSLAIQYLYEKMDFNFAKMCNIGAKAARGAYLLFLNDDIEVLDTPEGGKWLEYMLSYACRSHAGAVGAKLYYPKTAGGMEGNGCYKIQHAGITNMGIGPAHKLAGMEDRGILYHGHNTANYDMIAVTAACMLVRRAVFEEAGGFDETFAVAYNDVELCFRLYEKGFYNVQVNDAALMHHESLSRGQDTSPQKHRRLAREKQALYERHPGLRARDPFYSPNFVQWKKDVEYHTGYLYACDRQAKPALRDSKKTHTLLKRYTFRIRLREKFPILGKLYDKLTRQDCLQMQIDSIEEDGGLITINGWHIVRNRDNADLHKELWLAEEQADEGFGRVYAFVPAPKRREDVARQMSDRATKNIELSGIQLIFDKADIAPGTYRIGVLTSKKQMIFNENARLYVEGDDADG